ncbi:MFS general substrate transporter [Didymella exigua CBS 183.55]|uniref:MFS general substrate transporter n=1 Tax=Didymella exigua CBS 183.55 TaxID=1150837 RepID=A0A6A5RN00_9PLEO|nr:MFS general substrate transporter [Didymella exigua CBS 183.55]KAF1928813.1 MFS general substrate transporter [Didymella exigua CBS 183.55]
MGNKFGKPEVRHTSSLNPEETNVIPIDLALESALVRKQDRHILPMIFLMYFFTFLDRTNLGNARIAGMDKDLGLGMYGFNTGACLFYAVYFVADVPAALCVKKFGFVVLPLSCVCFGAVTVGTAFVRNSAGFYAIRILLGLSEAFQLPGLSYLVSRYYRRHEVTTRISFFMLGAAGFAGGFGGLLASGLLRLGSVGSVRSWRVIFLVEGIATIGFGIIALWLFPADPSTTRIFNASERKLAMRRLIHDQPAVVSHKEKITWSPIRRGVFNVNVLIGAWIFTCNQITVQGLSIFTPTILRLNFPARSLVQIQLLSSAPPLVGMLFSLGVAYVTMKTRRHGVAIAACAGLCVVGYAMWLGSRDPQVRFAAVFLNTAGGYGFGVLIIAWTLANAAPDTAKNVANAAVSGIANIGSIVATWSYISTDAKNGYKIGNALNTATALSVVIASVTLVLYQTKENRKRAIGARDYRVERSADEVARLGHLHPEFRYIR